MHLRVQELMAMGEISETSIPTDQTDTADTEPNPETPEETPEDAPKKKKKKKKDKVKEEEGDAQETPSDPQDGICTPELNGTMEEANGNEAGEKKKKKKKKEKRVKEEEDEVELCPTEVHGSDSSGYMSDKPSKKRKRETGSDVTSSVSEAAQTPKSKKKRKSDV